MLRANWGLGNRLPGPRNFTWTASASQPLWEERKLCLPSHVVLMWALLQTSPEAVLVATLLHVKWIFDDLRLCTCLDEARLNRAWKGHSGKNKLIKYQNHFEMEFQVVLTGHLASSIQRLLHNTPFQTCTAIYCIYVLSSLLSAFLICSSLSDKLYSFCPGRSRSPSLLALKRCPAGMKSTESIMEKYNIQVCSKLFKREYMNLKACPIPSQIAAQLSSVRASGPGRWDD